MRNVALFISAAVAALGFTGLAAAAPGTTARTQTCTTSEAKDCAQAGVAERKAGGTQKGATVELNPQPLPPGERKAGGTQRGATVELNPQPLPPRERKAGGDPGALSSQAPAKGN